MVTASLLALLGSSAASGCGDAVNLGENVDSGKPIDGGTAAGVTIVYQDANYFRGFAVDESTLYFAYPGISEPGTFWKTCDLEACATTVRTIHNPTNDVDLFTTESALANLAVANGEIFFTWFDERSEGYLMACPTTGCGDSPRKLTRVSLQASDLSATEEAVYWDDGVSLFKCAREGCSAPTSRNLAAFVPTGSQGLAPWNSMVVAGDFAYVTGSMTLARLKRDLSADPDWVYKSVLPIRGVAVSGEWVYFGVATLDGELRRCPLTGCIGEPEVVASGQPWPSSMVADERALHWLNYQPDGPNSLVGSMAAVTLDGQSTPRTLANGLKLRPDMRIRMNSHHVYWAETDFTPRALSSIRSFAQ
jgi:hypothetical protein